MTLASYLKERIIGQEEAIDEFCPLISRATSGFHFSDTPKASILFLGATGVGKTDSALHTCDFLFTGVENPREKRLARLDMSEYNTPESIHKLLGGPGQPSILEILYDQTEGKGIILWDEIEKAYTLVLDTLLQLLHPGRVRLTSGRVLDMRGYIVIATTNVGAQMLMDSQTIRRDKIKKRVENAALDILRPEILGRFNLLDAFSKLGENSTYRIAEIHAKECLRISRENGHDVTLSKDAIDSIRRAGYSERFGARPIKDQAMAIIGNAILAKGIPKVTGTLVYDARTKLYDIQ